MLYGNLSYDCSKDRLSPYAGMSMKRALNTIKSRTVERNNIEIPIEHKEFFGMYLLRISKERKKDIDNLFGFAQYLKDNGIKGIQIDVYGNGDYLDEFLNRLYENEYEDYICYCGETANPKNEMYAHDAVVDFTLNHSFGMPYIEAILNGKMLYCTENLASKEVLSGINGCIYSSYKDLVEKIHSFSDVTIEQLKSNYDKINSLYSRKVLAEKFVGFLNK